MATPPTPPPPTPPTPPPSTPSTPTFQQRLRTFGQQHYLKAAGAIGLAIIGVAVPGIFHAIGSLFDDKAPTCPGPACTGQPPKNCATDARTYEPTSGNPARLQIRYSPRCEAAWGRILAGQGGDTVSIAGGSAEPQAAKIDYGTDQFTNMIYVGKHFKLSVCAHPSDVATVTTWDSYCVNADQNSFDR